MRLTVPCFAAMHGGRTKSDLVTVPSKHSHAPLVVFQSRARCSGTSPRALQQGRGDARVVSACVARSHAVSEPILSCCCFSPRYHSPVVSVHVRRLASSSVASPRLGR